MVLVAPRVIAVIDDDATQVELVTTLLEDEGFRGITWSSEQGALDFLRREHPDVVILDLWMENHDSGRRILETMRCDEQLAAMPVIICSASSIFNPDEVDHYSALGAEIVRKPYNLDDLIDAVRRGLTGAPDDYVQHVTP